MKKRMKLLTSLLLLPWLIIGTAQAESITVNVSGIISEVYDPYGVVPDLAVGTAVSGEYIYETTTPDQDPSVEMGFYSHEGGTGLLSLSVGSYQVMTDTTQPHPFEIFIDDESMPGEEFYAASSSMLLPSNGATFDFASIEMHASNASVLPNALLSSTPPDISLFNNDKKINISGSKNNQYFYVTVDLRTLSTGNQATTQTSYEYKLGAVVTNLYDPYGQLDGKLEVNSAINASFVYDTLTPNSSNYPEEGLYIHAPGTGEIKVMFDDVVLSTDPSAQTPEVHVMNQVDPAYPDAFIVDGNWVVSNNTAITAYDISAVFDGPMLDSTLMPAGTLSLSGWDSAKVYVNGDGWYFEAMITSLELVQVSSVELFPSDGTVHPMQHFDLALRLNDKPNVMEIGGTLNGEDIAPILSNCAILPKLDTTQSVICPDANAMLVPGYNIVQFHLMLEDGSSLDTSVNWELRE